MTLRYKNMREAIQDLVLRYFDCMKQTMINLGCRYKGPSRKDLQAIRSKTWNPPRVLVVLSEQLAKVVLFMEADLAKQPKPEWTLTDEEWEDIHTYCRDLISEAV